MKHLLYNIVFLCLFPVLLLQEMQGSSLYGRDNTAARSDFDQDIHEPATSSLDSHPDSDIDNLFEPNARIKKAHEKAVLRALSFVVGDLIIDGRVNNFWRVFEDSIPEGYIRSFLEKVDNEIEESSAKDPKAACECQNKSYFSLPESYTDQYKLMKLSINVGKIFLRSMSRRNDHALYALPRLDIFKLCKDLHRFSMQFIIGSYAKVAIKEQFLGSKKKKKKTACCY